MYERFITLDKIYYNMREDMKLQGVKVNTRIKVGRMDIEFSTKLENSRWRAEPLPSGLPKIDLVARRRHSLTTSPSPGRSAIANYASRTRMIKKDNILKVMVMSQPRSQNKEHLIVM